MWWHGGQTSDWRRYANLNFTPANRLSVAESKWLREEPHFSQIKLTRRYPATSAENSVGKFRPPPPQQIWAGATGALALALEQIQMLSPINRVATRDSV
jgi:hypothetical protein